MCCCWVFVYFVDLINGFPLRNALKTIWSSTATGCCCHAETISGGSSMCAAQAEGAPVVKERQKKETSLPLLRRSVENSALCKMIQINHIQMLSDCVLVMTF